MKSPFDLVIIGARFPQLALGTLLSRWGLGVLILDHTRENNQPGGTQEQGYIFSRRPAPLFGLDSSGLLRHFLDEIGIGRVLVSTAYPKNQVSYQVVLPRSRINVVSNRDNLLDELDRDFPDSIDDFRKLYSDCDAMSGMWHESYPDLDAFLEKRHLFAALSARQSNRKAARQIESLTGSLLGRGYTGEFLSLQHHFLGSYPMNIRPGALASSLIHSIGRRGTFEEPTGSSSLTGLLATRFEEFGGVITSGAAVKNIAFKPKNSVEISLENGESFSGKCVATTTGILKDLGSGSELFNKKKEAPANPLVPFRFFLGIRDSIVPVGMEDNLLFLNEEDFLPGRGLYLSLSPQGSKMAPDGMRAMTVTILTEPDKYSELVGRTGDELQDALEKTLEPVIPYIHRGLTLVGSDTNDPDYGSVPRPLGGGTIAWSPGLVGKSTIQFINRGKAVLISPTPWELGIEGEMISALTAAVKLKKALG